MNAHILREINDAKSRFSAYYGLLEYRYKNLCAKADGASLMPVTVFADGFESNIEDVAMVAKPNDYQLAVIPGEERYLRELIKGIFEAHPEFKMKMMIVENGNARELDEDEAYSQSSKNGEKFLLYTMPDMDKDRRDVLRQGVKGLYEECMTKVDLVDADAKRRMEEGAFISTQKDMDEGFEALRQSRDLIKEKIDKLQQMKLEEIEEAYHHYLENQTIDEPQASEDYDVAKGMRIKADQ